MPKEINDIDIYEISITDRYKNSIEIIPSPNVGGGIRRSVFRGLILEESIFSPSVRGKLVIEDYKETLESSNIIGGELVKIKAATPRIGADIDLVLCVYEIHKMSNPADMKQKSSGESPAIYELSLCSPEFYYLQNEISYIEDDYIGSISSEGTSIVKTILNKFSEFSSAIGAGGENNKIKEIENSGNGLWLKKNNLTYPWEKERSNLDYFTTLNWISENTIGNNNPNNCSFLFYINKRGYNFRSIEDMILKGASNNFTLTRSLPGAGEYKYALSTTGYTNLNTIRGWTILQEYNHIIFSQMGAYGSKYNLIKPKYNDPYFDYVDFDSSHTNEKVVYEYHKDFDKWAHVEEHKLLPNDFEIKESQYKILYDDIFGYYGKGYNSPHEKEYEYLSKKNGRKEKKTWQNMFDISQLETETAKKIQKKIKDQLEENKKKYTDLLNRKAKFDFYECSICCLSGSSEDVENEEYGIVAAGSFTDAVNFTSDGISGNNVPGFTGGLLHFVSSYGITGMEGSFAETIKEFYHLKDSIPDFEEYVINLEIEKINLLIEAISRKLNACNAGTCKKIKNEESPENSLVGETSCEEEEFSCCECYGIQDNSSPPNNNLRSFFVGGGASGYEPSFPPESCCVSNGNERAECFTVEHSACITIGGTPVVGCECGSITCNPDTTYTLDGCELPTISCCTITYNHDGQNPSYETSCELMTYDECVALDGSTGIQGFVGSIDQNNLCGENPDAPPLVCDTVEPIACGCTLPLPHPNPAGGPPVILEGLCQYASADACYSAGGTIHANRSECLFACLGYCCVLDGPIADCCKPTTEEECLSDGGFWTPQFLHGYDSYPLCVLTCGCAGGEPIGGSGGECTCSSANDSCEAIDPAEITIPSVDNCVKEKNRLKEEQKKAQAKLATLISFKENFNELYEQFINKNAFFISKQPDLQKLNGITSSNSLFNVKSIKRIPVRGSRYEIFANKFIVGETGNSRIEQWLYSSYLGNDSSTNPLNVGEHPIYDQKYTQELGPGSFVDCSEKWNEYYECDSSGETCLPCCEKNEETQEITKFNCDKAEYCNRCVVSNYGGFSDETLETLDQFTSYCGNSIESCPTEVNTITEYTAVYEEHDISPPWGVIAPKWHPNAGEVLLPGGTWDPKAYSQRYNLYQDDLTDKKPSSIKRKELESFIRIEFENPIGINSLENFPTGFIRDSGYEYFLPYLVSITPGPFGRQSVNKNIAVIGMDPFGFDVAVESDESDHFLYPESSNKTPYFTTNLCSSRKSYSNFYGMGDMSSIFDNGSVHSVFVNNKPRGYYYFDIDKIKEVEITQNGCDGFNISTVNIEEDTNSYYIQTDIDRSIVYRNGLVEISDIWKYDITGNTDYGITEPPTKDKLNFGRNFSGQFIVHSRHSAVCKENNLTCMNPNGPVSSTGCPEEDPWCNCPCREYIPRKERIITLDEYPSVIKNKPSSSPIPTSPYLIIDENNDLISQFSSLEEATEYLNENGTISTKPTKEEIEKAHEETKECVLIEKELGKDWLGCLHSEPDSLMTCSCPCSGKNFYKYLEYNRTRSTFYNTPVATPLFRSAQLSLINSQKIVITSQGNFEREVGDIIEIEEPLTMDSGKLSRVSGKWLVSSLTHNILLEKSGRIAHSMNINCIRDTTNKPPEEREFSWLRSIPR